MPKPKPAKNLLEMNFKVSKKNDRLIQKIVDRLQKRYPNTDRMGRVMDLTVCHNHACRLDFEKLLKAPEFDFVHDIGGILQHLDHNTGELKNCFVPRCAAPSPREKVAHNKAVDLGYLPEKRRLR